MTHRWIKEKKAVDPLKAQMKQAQLDEKMALRKITTIMVELEHLYKITKGSENDLGVDIKEQFNEIDSSLRNIEQALISNTHIVIHQWITNWNNRGIK